MSGASKPGSALVRITHFFAHIGSQKNARPMMT
jgi:hypothetical protein